MVVLILLGLEAFMVQLFHATEKSSELKYSVQSERPPTNDFDVSMQSQRDSTHMANKNTLNTFSDIQDNSAWIWPDDSKTTGLYSLLLQGLGASVDEKMLTESPKDTMSVSHHVKDATFTAQRSLNLEVQKLKSEIEALEEVNSSSDMKLRHSIANADSKLNRGDQVASTVPQIEDPGANTVRDVFKPPVRDVFKPGVLIPNIKIKANEFLLEATHDSPHPTFEAIRVSVDDSDFPLPPPPVSYPAEKYRGMFRCDVETGCPTYAASFLTSKRQILRRFVNKSKLLQPDTNMESASYWTFGTRGISAVWTTVDALDFSVEHISMYERVLKSTSMQPSPLRTALLAQYDLRLQIIERDQRMACSEGPQASEWRNSRSRAELSISEKTVAVMPFYAVGSGSGHSIRTTKLRYLNITVHSIRCYFSSVVVAVSHESDHKYVLEDSGLPIFDVIFHRDLPKPSSTGIYTIRRVQDRLLTDPQWAKFEYIFYTEADQILHLRASPELVFLPLSEAAINDPANARSPRGAKQKRNILPAVVVPHRFHSVPMSDDFRHVDSEHNRSEVFHVLRTSQRPLIRLQQLAQKQGNGSNYIDANAYEWFYPDIKKPTIRRELELYQSRPRTIYDTKRPGDTCCFLRNTDDLVPLYPKMRDRQLVYDPATEIMRIGNGFGMVAGDCCFICIWKNRYCHNTCTPRRDNQGQSTCSNKGAFTTAPRLNVIAQPKQRTNDPQNGMYSRSDEAIIPDWLRREKMINVHGHAR